METKTRILAADSNKDFCRQLTELIAQEGDMEIVGTASDGMETLALLAEEKPDILLLDLVLPKLDGLEVLRRLREEGVKTPVMMLTARGEKDDRITGFDAGADDYLPKPFEPDELIARVRAMLRRGGAYTPAVLTFGDVSLDTGSGLLSCAGQSIRLSGREFQVMELFLRHVRVVLSADRIMERVWGWDSDAEINVVWVHISNLRKKLRAIGSTVTIRANRGLGYVLESSHD